MPQHMLSGSYLPQRPENIFPFVFLAIALILCISEYLCVMILAKMFPGLFMF